MIVLTQNVVDINDSEAIMAGWNRELLVLEDGTVTSAARGSGTNFDTKEEAEKAVEKYKSFFLNRFDNIKYVE